MGRAHLHDKISSKWARPICSKKNRVYGNETHLLDKLLEFGPERLFNHPHVMTPADYVGAIPTPCGSIQIFPRYIASTWTMEYCVIIMQIAQTGTPSIDENIFIGLSGLQKHGMLCNKQDFFLQVSSVDFTCFQ